MQAKKDLWFLLMIKNKILSVYTRNYHKLLPISLKLVIVILSLHVNNSSIYSKCVVQSFYDNLLEKETVKY